MTRMYDPAHPGTILRVYFEGRSDEDAAASVGIFADHLRAIYQGQVDITLELDGRLGQLTGTSDRFWLRMQQGRDEWLREATSKLAVAED